MSDAIWIALLSGPVVLGLREGIAWFRNRRKDVAEADRVEAENDLTIGQGWRDIVKELRSDITNLRDRVGALEGELDRERERSKALVAEVDRYKQIGRSLLRYVLRLRDGLVATGAEVPPMPTDIEDAMTYFNLP